jgi:hypothetical protein
MCLRILRGILLSPELLFALKLCWRTAVSSAGVMCEAGAFSRGVNVSEVILSS